MMNKYPIEHILCITLSNIGDVVMTTPVLHALHQQYPNAVIDIVGDARSDSLFKHLPFLGQMIRKQKGASLSQTIQLIRQIRQTKYDIAVDLRTDGLLHVVNARRKYHKLANRKTLHLHSVEKHFAVLAPFIQHPMHETHIVLSSQEVAAAKQWLAGQGLGHQPILGLGLGANFIGKIWPVERFVALAQALLNRFPAVVLLGSQADQVLAQRFLQQINHPTLQVVNACGKFDLLTTSALLAQTDFFVGNDSGLGHLASAVDVPTFTVFGVGQPDRYRPWGDKALWYQDPAREIANVPSQLVCDRILQYLAK